MLFGYQSRQFNLSVVKLDIIRRYERLVVGSSPAGEAKYLIKGARYAYFS